MKRALLKFRQLLEEKGVEVEDIRFKFHGKVVYIGFSACFGKTIVEVQPQYNNVWLVDLTYNYLSSWGTIERNHTFTHYAKKREGFYPSFCRPFSLMKKEIINSLFMDSLNVWKTTTGKFRLFSRLHDKSFTFDEIEAADTFADYLREAEKWFERPTPRNVEDRRLFCQKENLFLNTK